MNYSIKPNINICEYCLITRSYSPALNRARFMQLSGLIPPTLSFNCYNLNKVFNFEAYMEKPHLFHTVIHSKTTGKKIPSNLLARNIDKDINNFFMLWRSSSTLVLTCFLFVKSIKNNHNFEAVFVYHGNKCKQLFLVAPQQLFSTIFFAVIQNHDTICSGTEF